MKKLLLLCFIAMMTLTAKAQNLTRFESDGKIGFKNSAGEIIVPAQYDYSHSELIRIDQNAKYGFIDLTGKIIIPCIYDKAMDFIEGLSIVSLNKKVFIINEKGREIKALKYNELGFGYKSGLVFHVAIDNKWGLIDEKGNELVYPKYERLSRFNGNNLVFAKLNNKWGVIDRNGNTIKPFIFKERVSMNTTKKSYYRVKSDTKFGVIDSNGNEILPLIYDRINFLSRNSAIEFQLNGRIGYIDTETKKTTFVELSKERELSWIEAADSPPFFEQ